MQDFLHEEGFDEREQQEIIAHAASLQRARDQHATLNDLERAASELGIEPRFVREAVRQRREGQGNAYGLDNYAPPQRGVTLLVSGIFAVFELSFTRHSLDVRPFTLTTAALGLAFAAVYAYLIPLRSENRRLVGAAPLVVTILAMIVTTRVRHYGFNTPMALELLWVAALQGAVGVACMIARSRNAEASRIRA